MPVSSTAKATTCAALLSDRVIVRPPVLRKRDPNFDLPMGRELDCVGQKVLEDLLKSLRIAIHCPRQFFGEEDS